MFLGYSPFRGIFHEIKLTYHLLTYPLIEDITPGTCHCRVYSASQKITQY